MKHRKFWPVYNEYRDELDVVRKETKNDVLVFEEKVINVKKKYKTEFRKILASEARVNQVFVAEKNFRELLRKELMNRRGNRQQNNPEGN
jgi:site-specific recombinase XerD